MAIYLFLQILKFTKYSIKLIEKLSRRHLIKSSHVFVIKGFTVEDTVVFICLKVLIIFYVFYSNNVQVTFVKNFTIKHNQFINVKHWYFIHNWSDNAFKGSVVIRAFPSVHWGQLKITLTVSLSRCITEYFVLFFQKLKIHEKENGWEGLK